MLVLDESRPISNKITACLRMRSGQGIGVEIREYFAIGVLGIL